MATDSARRVTLVDEPPVFDGAALQLRFVVDVDGELQTGAITVEALEDHFGARSALEDDLRDAFDELDVDARQRFALAVGHLDHQAIRDVLGGP